MKYKKFISLILCFTLILQMFFYKYHEFNVEASTFVMPSDNYMKSIIAPMLVSAGLIFKSQQALNDTVEKVQLRIIQGGLDSNIPQPPWSPRPPRSWRDFITSIGSGYLLYDFATNSYKKVIDVGDDFFYFIKKWVDDNFNVGSNVILPPGFYDLFKFEISDKIPFSITGFNSSIVFYNSNFEPKFYGIRQGNNVYMDDYKYFPSSSGTSVIYPLIVSFTPSFSFDSYRYGFKVYENGNTNIVAKGIRYFTLDTVVIDNKTSLVFGSENIVDNPNFNWNNLKTGNKSIVLPIETSEEGLPIFTSDGLPVPSISPDYMLNVNPDVIPKQDATGVIYNPNTDVLPEPFAPGYPENLPNIDIDNTNKRALLFRKFPFCLPWDLMTLVNLLNAPALAPRFEIDIVPQKLKNDIGIKNSTKFVFDMAEYPLVGRMSRWFGFITCILSLILITRNIMRS